MVHQLKNTTTNQTTFILSSFCFFTPCWLLVFQCVVVWLPQLRKSCPHTTMFTDMEERAGVTCILILLTRRKRSPDILQYNLPLPSQCPEVGHVAIFSCKGTCETKNLVFSVFIIRSSSVKKNEVSVLGELFMESAKLQCI